MVPAAELRIGNYILTSTNSVTPIQSGGINAIEMGRLIVNPIPFTKEWSLKFGFQGDTLRCNENEEYDFNLVLDDNGVLWMYPNEGTVKLEHIKHVHQFQNLYFILNNKEAEFCKCVMCKEILTDQENEWGAVYDPRERICEKCHEYINEQKKNGTWEI